MKHGVDVARQYAPDAVAFFPRRAKPVGVVATAEEAWAMSRRERGRLVKKEQRGPAAASHHLAPPAFEFADASEPRPAGPAPRQGFRCGVVDDAAIAGEQSAMRGSDDVACWRDPVLQRHLLRTKTPSPRLRGEGREVTPRRRGSAAGTRARYPRERRSRCLATLP